MKKPHVSGQPLLQPYQLGALTLPNRVALSLLTAAERESDANTHGVLDEKASDSRYIHAGNPLDPYLVNRVGGAQKPTVFETDWNRGAAGRLRALLRQRRIC